MEEIEQLTRFEKAILEGLPHLSISYEKDLQDSSQHASTVQKISHFLNVNPIWNGSALKKILPKNISHFIKNPDEIIAFLKEKKKYQIAE